MNGNKFFLDTNIILKIPDSIIAGSAIAFEIPLVTADKGFKKISKLTIDFYNK